MLSKSHSKLILSLKDKKNREKHERFVVEGMKSVQELVRSEYEVETLYCTKQVEHLFPSRMTKVIVSEEELRRISFTKNPNKVLALARIPQKKNSWKDQSLVLALDRINDPGNLGTLIRLADWFGISHILCSHDTVDQYNPKVIQAAMGSFTRVTLEYIDLQQLIKVYEESVYGAFLEGENVYQTTLNTKGILVLGNEANGISAEVAQHISQRITIPSFGHPVESLNVASAAAILLSEFKRSTWG